MNITAAYQFTALFILGALVFASGLHFIILRMKPQNTTLQKVSVIIKSWWWICGVLLFLLFWQKWGIITGMFLFSILSVREYLKQSKIEHKKYLMVSLSVLCVLQYFSLALGNTFLFMSIIPILCLWIVPGLVIFKSTIKDLEIVAAVGFGLPLLIYYLSHVAALFALPDLKFTVDESTYALLVLVLITWSNDIFQFIAGKSFGKRKIVSQVSPNKTLGGFVGGLMGSVILALIVGPSFLRLDSIYSVFLGVLMGLSGMFGDLFFSAIKRNIGIKDFSQAIPGHGGLLDRLDSLIFIAPIYFHFLLYFAR